MLAERLARLLASVLMLAALVGSVLAGGPDAGAATEITTTGFEWGAPVSGGSPAGAVPLQSSTAGGNV